MNLIRGVFVKCSECNLVIHTSVSSLTKANALDISDLWLSSVESRIHTSYESLYGQHTAYHLRALCQQGAWSNSGQRSPGWITLARRSWRPLNPPPPGDVCGWGAHNSWITFASPHSWVPLQPGLGCRYVHGVGDGGPEDRQPCRVEYLRLCAVYYMILTYVKEKRGERGREKEREKHKKGILLDFASRTFSSRMYSFYSFV